MHDVRDGRLRLRLHRQAELQGLRIRFEEGCVIMMMRKTALVVNPSSIDERDVMKPGRKVENAEESHLGCQ